MHWVHYVLRASWLILRNLRYRRLLLFLGVVLLMLATWLQTLRIFRLRKQRLSYMVWAEKQRMFKFRFYDRLIFAARNLYNPSPGSLAVILFLAIIVGGAILWFGSGNASTGEELQLITRLQNLDAGIALVFIPFTIFAVGLSARRTESGVSAAEVLLRETYIFPTTVFVLCLLAAFAFIKRPSGAKALICITFCMALVAIYRLCRVLLDEQRFHISATHLLQDKIRRTIQLALDERIGKNLLLKQLEGKPIEYSLRPRQSGGEYFEVTAVRKGIVQDIYLDRLFSFAEELENAANTQGFSFDEKQVAEDIEPRQQPNQEPGQVRAKDLKPNRNRYILKLFKDQVSDRSDYLVSFSRALVPDPQKRQHLAERARGAFLIKPGDSYSAQVERYLKLIKEEAIAAIKDRRTVYLESLLTVFAELTTTFLEEMKKAIGGHTFQAALSERQTLYGGWNEVTWMSRHLSEIHYRGCRSEDIYVAKIVAAAPFRIAYTSISYHDNLVFDLFTSFATPLYSALDDVKDPKIKQLLFNTCSGYLKDIGEVGIALELERPENGLDDLERIGSLATILLVRYEELLKLSFDKRDLEHFEDFKREMNGLFQYVPSRLNPLPVKTVVTETNVTLLDEDRASLNGARDRHKATLDILKKIGHQKRQLLFAIGSYVFDVATSSDDQKVHACLTQIDDQLSTNPLELTNLYISMEGPEPEQIWGRIFYEAAPMGAWVGNTGTDYFCYLLLKSTYQFNDKQFEAVRLPTEPNFVSNIREGGPIAAPFRSFQDEREKWAKLVPDDWLKSISKLQQIFTRISAERKIADEDKVIQAPLDEEYLRAFRARFTKEFDKNAVLRKLFKDLKAYKPEALIVSSPPTGPKWGLSLLDMKQAYTADGHRTYFNWPEEYARKLATSESEYVFHQILQELPNHDLTRVQGLEARITAIAHELGNRKIKPNIILVARQSILGLTTDSFKNFKPYWTLKSDFAETWGFLGKMLIQDQEVPVFAVWTTQDANLGCALELPSCMLWKQQSPADNPGETPNVHGLFYIQITDFSRQTESRRKILESNPEWLRTQADKESYLSLRVWLQIFERFEIKVLNKNLGLKFNLSA
ncbi:MAG: hypothetical protein WAN12_13100 [Candidatus Acidiferrum sp.]